MQDKAKVHCIIFFLFFFYLDFSHADLGHADFSQSKKTHMPRTCCTKYYLNDLSELTSEDSSQVVKDDFYLVSDNCHPLHLELKL